jgi:hypothetical protein
MPDRLPDPLRDLADIQRGILTRRQAESVGFTRDMIRARLESGRWQRLYAGVYATFSGVPDRQATLWAALLRVGTGAALSHHTAAEVDRLADRPSALIHVTVPPRKVAPIRGVVVHARKDAAHVTHPTRLPPRLRIEATVLDLAGESADGGEAIAWVTTALGRRLTTPERLTEALERRPRSRWRRELMDVLSPDMRGVHSLLEYHYVRDVESPHRLPKGTRQALAGQPGRREYRDVFYDAYELIVELDGKIAHPDEARGQDKRRDNSALADGLGTLRFDYWEVRSGPCKVAAQVAKALQSRGWSGVPRPCSPACPIPRAA